ncbi:MAG TPA: response regulator [Ignavibacteriaceae bacterium]|nr:response regulator [Ignavibacteriaceae bacterium]
MTEPNSKTILLIDDDITIRKLVSRHLKNEHYNVLEADGSKEGFNHLQNNPVDLVLCDVTMDEMDGFTFCKQVRGMENYRLIPFVFVTAKNSFEDKSHAHEAGGDDLITKPFNLDELLLKVRALIRRSDIYKIYGAKRSLQKSFGSNKTKILLVDDDITSSKIFQMNLRKSGFECEAVNNPEEALKLAKSSLPDIIISDIVMPGMDGFTFRKAVLEDKDLKSVPFIFLTGKGEEEDILSGFDLGITDYVVKSSGPKVVAAKVTAIINSLGKEKEKIVSELHQAADSLRVKVVPDNDPVFNGFQIKHWHQPFQGIPGGDFIDFIQQDEDNIVIVLGDVMGKKWGAWYFAFAYAGYVRSATRIVLQSLKNYTPKEILQQVNKAVYQDAKISEVFATLSIIVISRGTRQLLYAGAGDLPILYRNSASGEINKIYVKGMLLGFAADGNYEDSLVRLNKDDIVLLASDGLIECRNSNGEQFGKNELLKSIKKLNPSVDPLESIRTDFVDFTAGKFEDDISLITIRAE